MWLLNPINPFKYKVVRRFDQLVAIAKVLRGCHFYYVSSLDHCMYGIAEGSSTIRKFFIPLNIDVTASFMFRLDTLDLDIIGNYIDFAILDDMPWAMLPLIKRDEFPEYQPLFKPVTEYKLWTIIDRRSKQEIEFLDLYGVEGVKSIFYPNAQQVVADYMAARRKVSPQEIIFENMHRSPIVKDVFSMKASMGERFLPLRFNDRSYGFYLYKNLFTFNKNDGLTIKVRDRLDFYNVFEAEFIVRHDKNPIKFISNDFEETTIGTFIRVN